MPVSLYDISIPVTTLGLKNLAAILDKAAAYEEAKKVDPKAFGQSRLIVDMFPLARQVQIACDVSKGAAARLAGVPIPKHEDTETTLAELKARIQKTLDFIETIKPGQLAGADGREIVIEGPRVTLRFSALDYVRKFVLPNFFFHVTMAYALLRANGVEIGKNDFLGAVH
jgi:uncharacterized protein